MSLVLDDGDVRLYHGDALTVLQTLEAESVQCCVTSPPFYGLRDYGTGRWEGGNPDCDHSRSDEHAQLRRHSSKVQPDRRRAKHALADAVTVPTGDVCGKCGAQRVDQQIGLEETPEQWVDSLVAVFRRFAGCYGRRGRCGSRSATATHNR